MCYYNTKISLHCFILTDILAKIFCHLQMNYHFQSSIALASSSKRILRKLGRSCEREIVYHIKCTKTFCIISTSISPSEPPRKTTCPARNTEYLQNTCTRIIISKRALRYTRNDVPARRRRVRSHRRPHYLLSLRHAYGNGPANISSSCPRKEKHKSAMQTGRKHH